MWDCFVFSFLDSSSDSVLQTNLRPSGRPYTLEKHQSSPLVGVHQRCTFAITYKAWTTALPGPVRTNQNHRIKFVHVSFSIKGNRCCQDKTMVTRLHGLRNHFTKVPKSARTPIECTCQLKDLCNFRHHDRVNSTVFCLWMPFHVRVLCSLIVITTMLLLLLILGVRYWLSVIRTLVDAWCGFTFV